VICKLSESGEPNERAFQVSKSYRKNLRRRKHRIQRRLKPRQWPEQPQPMFDASNIHYEMSEKCQASSYGGIGAIHLMVQKLGLVIVTYVIAYLDVRTFPVMI